jgi:hypothetical protein
MIKFLSTPIKASKKGGKKKSLRESKVGEWRKKKDGHLEKQNKKNLKKFKKI